jgi:hypothetical protein
MDLVRYGSTQPFNYVYLFSLWFNIKHILYILVKVNYVLIDIKIT